MDMARPFEQITSDRLQIREGGGCMAAFGLPFFAAGVFIIVSAAGVVRISNDSEMRGWGWVAMAFGSRVYCGRRYAHVRTIPSVSHPPRLNAPFASGQSRLASQGATAQPANARIRHALHDRL
jgi:hypothetical protein